MFDDCPVEVLQSEKEFSRLLEVFRELKPTRILEIGSLFGGTLWYWIQNAVEYSKIATVDLLVPESDSRYERQRYGQMILWPHWAKDRKILLAEYSYDSSHSGTIRLVKAFIPEIDFLFIDGDHREEIVRRDFESYSPLVRQGGVIAFHDIGYEQHSEYFGVRLVWDRIKSNGFRTEEIIEKPGEWGIGILYK